MHQKFKSIGSVDMEGTVFLLDYHKMIKRSRKVKKRADAEDVALNLTERYE